MLDFYYRSGLSYPAATYFSFLPYYPRYVWMAVTLRRRISWTLYLNIRTCFPGFLYWQLTLALEDPYTWTATYMDLDIGP